MSFAGLALINKGCITALLSKATLTLKSLLLTAKEEVLTYQHVITNDDCGKQTYQ